MVANRLLPFWAAVLLTLAGTACQNGAASGEGDAPAPEKSVALFTSLPIYWGEGAEMSDILNRTDPPGWARQTLEQRFVIKPVDALEDENLAGVERLVLAQPRPLAPSENLALDNWVRGGGRVLVFADPVLTRHSRYGLGDRRRPQDTVLLSPILTRWGLELRYDEEQVAGERLESADGRDVLVNLPGSFALREGGVDAKCALSHAGLVADCRIGKGRALLVADAALLDDDEDGGTDAARRSDMLGKLLADSLES